MVSSLAPLRLKMDDDDDDTFIIQAQYPLTN